MCVVDRCVEGLVVLMMMLPCLRATMSGATARARVVTAESESLLTGIRVAVQGRPVMHDDKGPLGPQPAIEPVPPIVDGPWPRAAVHEAVDDEGHVHRRAVGAFGLAAVERDAQIVLLLFAALHDRLREGFRRIAIAEPQRCVLIEAAGDEASVHRAMLAAVGERFGIAISP